jgi:hypothetical protein
LMLKNIFTPERDGWNGKQTTANRGIEQSMAGR